jgi:hypothetical protein
LCTEGRCQECTTTPDNCGFDTIDVCSCRRPVVSGPRVCTTHNPTDEGSVGQCDQCPQGSTCVVSEGGELFCHNPCGAP